MRRSPSSIFLDVSPLTAGGDFRFIYAARIISLVSIGLIGVAVSLQVYTLSGSSFHVGLVNLCLAIPMMAGLLAGGVLSDRVDLRRLMVGTRTAYIGVVATFIANTLLPEPRLWIIYAAATVAGVINGLSAPPLLAALPVLVSRARLAAAAALMTAANQVGTIIAPSLAGVVIDRAGYLTCYGIVAAGAILTPVVLARMQPLPRAGAAAPSVRHALLEAWRFVRTDRLILALLLIDVAAALFASPTALFPELGTRYFGGEASTVGLLYTAPAIGALGLALTSGWMGRISRPGLALVTTVILWGGATALFGATRSLSFALVFLAVAGGARAGADILRRTLLQHHTPDALQGRIGSLWLVQATVLPSIGMAIAGAMTRVLPAPTVALVGGILCVLGTLAVVVTYPELGRTPTVGATAPTP